VPENYFDEPVAAQYDETSADMFRPEALDPVVDLLAGLSAGGAALELGVGTGRVALPLLGRGIHVHGIELSPAMVDRLRAKPGGGEIEVAVGDFATTRVEGRFRLAYLVFNTIMNLTTQAEQVACFANVAEHLEPGGCFVVEVTVPDLQRLPPGESVVPFDVSPTHLGFDEYTDLVDQILYSHHYLVSADKVEYSSTPFRYVWPAELDLMAQLAGMSLRDRWGGWHQEPFTGESRSHVSVWVKDDDQASR
jgi:hypothetical protein